MAACPKSRPQNDRKRQHAEADLSQDDLHPQHTKRLKSSKELRSASNFPPTFWDSLSRVWLTRRALRELDRRNQLKSSVCARGPAHKPVGQLSNRKDLQRFARLGGPKLGDLRGFPDRTQVNVACKMGSRRSINSTRSSRGKQNKSTKSTSNSAPETSTEGSGRRSSAYDADFEQHLIDNGIYPKGYEYPDDRETPEPSNLEDIRQRITQPRPSLSPSRFSSRAFREFVRANDRVIKEGDVMRTVLPTVCGVADIPNQEDLLFTRLESITSETTVDAKPDFYDGARLESIDKQVRTDLGPYIIPTGHRTAPAVPNFFIEAKAPKGGADVLKRQITHDLSLGARVMHKLQSYDAGEPVFDNNAYTLGATYHAGTGTLQMYATHITPTGPGGSLEYHTTQTGAHALIGDPDTCRKGAAALRNGRDMAREWRNQFISNANERARFAELSALNSSSNSGNSGTADAHPVEESQTSTDDYETAVASVLVTAPSYLVEEYGYDDLSDLIEEPEASADEATSDPPMKPPSSRTRPSKGSERVFTKAPRKSTSMSRRKHRPKS